MEEIGRRVLPGGETVIIYPLTFGRARLTVSCGGSLALGFYDDAW